MWSWALKVPLDGQVFSGTIRDVGDVDVDTLYSIDAKYKKTETIGFDTL
jgi:hypothetical protein